MSRTFIRQDTQIRKSDVYDDTITPSLANFETNPVHIEDDLNTLRSQVHNLLKNYAGNWYDDLNTPVTLDPGTERGVNDLNSDLHLLERKRVLVMSCSLADITVPATQNWTVLSLSQLPSNTTAAIGAVTTRGTVAAAHGGAFGTTQSMTEVSGVTAVSPKNLCEIVDGASRDPILSSGRVIYALFQTESSTDGSTMTGTTPNRAQLSFVRINAAGDDLEACPVIDIESKVINYCSVERKALEDFNEQDFLKGNIDVPAGTTVTRQVSYDNQSTSPVDLLTNATLDLEGAGLVWAIRDDLQALLFRIIEGSAGGTSEVELGPDVDVFDVDALVNDFAEGLRIDTGGQRINLGETAGLIESTAANDLRILGARELLLDDGNQAGSTWAQTAGIKLSDTTAEWDAFETQFGEVSLLSAITSAATTSARGTKVYAAVTATIAADANVTGAGGTPNIDAQLPDMSAGSFLTDYDIFLNGELLRPGANAAANHDYYPGTSLANGDLKFEFVLKAGSVPDVICAIVYT